MYTIFLSDKSVGIFYLNYESIKQNYEHAKYSRSDTFHYFYENKADIILFLTAEESAVYQTSAAMCSPPAELPSSPAAPPPSTIYKKWQPTAGNRAHGSPSGLKLETNML